MFAPVDKHQEMNIKDIKVTYRSQGPNIDWQYIKKLHPAIHVIQALTIHMEEEFGTLARGKNHTIPKEELDITRQLLRFHFPMPTITGQTPLFPYEPLISQ